MSAFRGNAVTAVPKTFCPKTSRKPVPDPAASVAQTANPPQEKTGCEPDPVQFSQASTVKARSSLREPPARASSGAVEVPSNDVRVLVTRGTVSGCWKTAGTNATRSRSARPANVSVTSPDPKPQAWTTCGKAGRASGPAAALRATRSASKATPQKRTSVRVPWNTLAIAGVSSIEVFRPPRTEWIVWSRATAGTKVVARVTTGTVDGGAAPAGVT